jgi:hypothetical protein
MNRVLLAIGAAAVAAMIVVLWLALRTDSGASASTQKSGANEPATPGSSAPDRSARPTVTPSVEPRGSGQAGTGTDEPTTYAVGDVEVRDHRTGNHAPIDLPPNVHPADTHRISSKIVNDLSLQIQAVMKQCAVEIPPEARGDKPRLEGTIFIAIKGEQAKITDAAMQLRNVVGASVEPTKQCIMQKSVGITATATGEPETEKYTISVSFALL